MYILSALVYFCHQISQGPYFSSCPLLRIFSKATGPSPSFHFPTSVRSPTLTYTRLTIARVPLSAYRIVIAVSTNRVLCVSPRLSPHLALLDFVKRLSGKQTANRSLVVRYNGDVSLALPSPSHRLCLSLCISASVSRSLCVCLSVSLLSLIHI